MDATGIPRSASLPRLAQATFSTVTRSYLVPALGHDGQDVRVPRSTRSYESDRTYIPAGKKKACMADPVDRLLWMSLEGDVIIKIRRGRPDG
jgi:hypothetical protein